MIFFRVNHGNGFLKINHWLFVIVMQKGIFDLCIRFFFCVVILGCEIYWSYKMWGLFDCCNRFWSLPVTLRETTRRIVLFRGIYSLLCETTRSWASFWELSLLLMEVFCLTFIKISCLRRLGKGKVILGLHHKSFSGGFVGLLSPLWKFCCSSIKCWLKMGSFVLWHLVISSFWANCFVMVWIYRTISILIYFYFCGLVYFLSLCNDIILRFSFCSSL